ncbi:hypothetical protein D5086_029465 [Populus alba]|uniref:Uncharacterized protein n=1 Tax=Populus alba TaxID=43335 RepID=A0ACC4ATL3_POPAL
MDIFPRGYSGLWLQIASVWFLVVLMQNFRGSLSTSKYLIGLGSCDMTGPAADVNMMGYANTEQIASGVHFRLRARAFMVAEPQGSRVVYVNLDACMASQIVTIKVLERLKASFFFLRKFMKCATAIINESAVKRTVYARAATTHLALDKLVADKDTELVVFS